MKILHLGTKTPGDGHFLSRWETVGTVSQYERDPDILVVDQYQVVNDQLLDKFPNLKYVCSATTGHTHLQFNATKRNITLITLRDEKVFMKSITSVSEFTMYLILKCARELPVSPVKLSGKSIGILGKGRVGSHVGAICEAMGMQVKYFDKEHNRHYLKSLFRYSDFISVHLSENENTIGLVNHMYLNLMRPTAFLINTARASIVDEAVVRKLILMDKIGGYASDVTPLNSPANLYHPKIILTGHIGGRCLDDRIATDKFIIKKTQEKIKSLSHIQ